jgi:hypothetical protein
MQGQPLSLQNISHPGFHGDVVALERNP